MKSNTQTRLAIKRAGPAFPTLRLSSSSSHSKDPEILELLSIPNLKDGRVVIFWLLQLVSAISFITWLGIANYVSKDRNQPITSPKSTNTTLPGNITTVRDIGYRSNSMAMLMSVDVWFALGTMASLDAFAIVFNFIRALINRFHYAVSLRMMFLASIAALYVWFWRSGGSTYVSSRLVALLLGTAVYFGFGKLLDKCEEPLPIANAACHEGTIQQYRTAGFGLVLSAIVPSTWSSLIPICHAAFEAVFLAAIGASRTPRYIVLSSSVLQSTICLHWGVRPLSTSLSLSVPPCVFVASLLGARLLLDGHLPTVFRHSREL
ncbi:hypothetical protein VHEMI10346 [[Torrubiella] hemipterigena]|uniref:Uncharacterized protein n=1 Tax=[Torrubiella] hemipterigena TaxID=1531966 RepID=A0A0A1TS05_9HYPO|nr:hypothetical protein VHEMI10346 [[Torrubiella] hemipterigena]